MGTAAHQARGRRACGAAAEAVLLGMACAAPWAFGAVEAWAQLVLVVGVAALAVLRVPQQWARPERRAVTALPALALAGLVTLALAQAAPWPAGALAALAPGAARLRAELVPAAPERVAGDSSPPVPLPRRSVSVRPEATLQAAAGLACAWIVFQTVLGLGTGPEPYRRFAVALAANAAALALFSVVQRLAWNGKIYGWRDAPAGCAGPFVDHNHLAAYLNLGLGAALGLLLGADTRRRAGRFWPGYAAGLIVVGILVSLSRSGFLGMAAALVGGALLLRRDRPRLLAALGAAAVVAALLLAALGTSQGYGARLGTLLGRAPYASRLRVWAGALRAWPQSPLVGSGLGTFASATAPGYRFDASEAYQHAENEYVEWLVEGGLLGLGLVLAGAGSVLRLGRRAADAAGAPANRALVLGGMLGLAALAVHSAGDFALRIPAVTLVAVILAAHLTRLGLAAGAPVEAAPARWRVPGVACLVAVAAVALVVPAFHAARAEALAGAAGMPLDGSFSQRLLAGADAWDAKRLDAARRGLELALQDRPDWADGHLALGLVLVRQYEATARQALARAVDDPALRARLARPLWLSLRVRTAGPEEPLTATALLELDAVRALLVPAARSFLEARRCDVLRPRPHTELATLAFLLAGADPGRAYLERALRLAGGNSLEIARVADVAAVWGETDLAARCWRDELALGARPWTETADMAYALLAPEAILRDVVPDGPHAVRFAQYLFAGPDDAHWRRRFAAEALRRLERDQALPAADRLALEAEAHALLDDRTGARRQMLAALALRPDRTAWRNALVDWLIAWERPDEAYAQARLGAALRPGDAEARGALERAADALTRADQPARGSPAGAADAPQAQPR